MHVLELVPV